MALEERQQRLGHAIRTFTSPPDRPATLGPLLEATAACRAEHWPELTDDLFLERAVPITGLLAPFASAAARKDVWDVMAEAYDYNMSVLAEAELDLRDGERPVRRRLAVLACAAGMWPWLAATPYRSGNVWCAEVSGRVAARSYGIDMAPNPIYPWNRGALELYESTLQRAVSGAPDHDAAAAFCDHFPEDLLHRLTDPAVLADLALTLLEGKMVFVG